MEKILLTEEELNESRIISQIQADLNSHVTKFTREIESLKLKRKYALEELNELDEKNKVFFKGITNKYGYVKINLETGEVTPIDEK
jgi:hypothetical protein